MQGARCWRGLGPASGSKDCEAAVSTAERTSWRRTCGRSKYANGFASVGPEGRSKDGWKGGVIRKMDWGVASMGKGDCFYEFYNSLYERKLLILE
jgi:hypothetical protein